MNIMDKGKTMKKEGYLSKKDLAKWLGKSVSTVLRYEKEGKLPKAWRPTSNTTLYNLQKCIEMIEKSSTSASA